MARVRADVVLCDVEMPGHGRLWLAAQLRDRYPMSAMVLATAIDSVWHVDAVERSLKPAPARESMSTWLDSSLDNE